MNITMTEQENDRWIDLAKLVAICIGPFFLIQTYIKSYFKDKANEREAALKILVENAIDEKVNPQIDRLSNSINKLNETIIEMRLNK